MNAFHIDTIALFLAYKSHNDPGDNIVFILFMIAVVVFLLWGLWYNLFVKPEEEEKKRQLNIKEAERRALVDNQRKQIGEATLPLLSDVVSRLEKINRDIGRALSGQYFVPFCSKCEGHIFILETFDQNHHQTIKIYCQRCNRKSWAKLKNKNPEDTLTNHSRLVEMFKRKTIEESKAKELLQSASVEGNAIQPIRNTYYRAFQHILIEGEERKPKRNSTDKVLRTLIPQDVRDAVWRRDGGKCVQCGSNKRLEFDHIIPIAKGGSNTYRNIQLLCEECNRTKSDKIG